MHTLVRLAQLRILNSLLKLVHTNKAQAKI